MSCKHSWSEGIGGERLTFVSDLERAVERLGDVWEERPEREFGNDV